MLRKKLSNVGFDEVATVDRRPFGVVDLARYPLFPAEFLDFLRRVLPPGREHDIVHSVVVTGRKPR